MRCRKSYLLPLLAILSLAAIAAYELYWIKGLYKTRREAADLAGDVRPKMVIPGHWDMFADNSEDPELFKKYIEAKYKDGLVCRIPKVLEKIVVR